MPRDQNCLNRLIICYYDEDASGVDLTPPAIFVRQSKHYVSYDMLHMRE